MWIGWFAYAPKGVSSGLSKIECHTGSWPKALKLGRIGDNIYAHRLVNYLHHKKEDFGLNPVISSLCNILQRVTHCWVKIPSFRVGVWNGPIGGCELVEYVANQDNPNWGKKNAIIVLQDSELLWFLFVTDSVRWSVSRKCHVSFSFYFFPSNHFYTFPIVSGFIHFKTIISSKPATKHFCDTIPSNITYFPLYSMVSKYRKYPKDPNWKMLRVGLWFNLLLIRVLDRVCCVNPNKIRVPVCIHWFC